MLCPECYSEIPDNANFCRYCGASVTKAPEVEKIKPKTRKVCPACCTVYEKDVNFCRFCGSRLETMEEDLSIGKEESSEKAIEKEVFGGEENFAREDTVEEEEVFRSEENFAREDTVEEEEVFGSEEDFTREDTVEEEEVFESEEDFAREDTVEEEEVFGSEENFAREDTVEEEEVFGSEENFAREDIVEEEEVLGGEENFTREDIVEEEEVFRAEEISAGEEAFEKKEVFSADFFEEKKPDDNQNKIDLQDSIFETDREFLRAGIKKLDNAEAGWGKPDYSSKNYDKLNVPADNKEFQSYVVRFGSKFENSSLKSIPKSLFVGKLANFYLHREPKKVQDERTPDVKSSLENMDLSEMQNRKEEQSTEDKKQLLDDVQRKVLGQKINSDNSGYIILAILGAIFLFTVIFVGFTKIVLPNITTNSVWNDIEYVEEYEYVDNEFTMNELLEV